MELDKAESGVFGMAQLLCNAPDTPARSVLAGALHHGACPRTQSCTHLFHSSSSTLSL
jgi:hypothetical protein